MDVPVTHVPHPDDPRRPMHEPKRGRAALLLVESLMHCLVAKNLISREEFVEIVEGAADVEREMTAADPASPADAGESLLFPLANAFRRELGR